MSILSQWKSEEFRAALATPLASIFGSGFLIIVPILAATLGSISILGMAAVIIAAYAVGEVIRFNIRYAEPKLQAQKSSGTHSLESLSDLALTVAYVVSVSLYLSILSAFVLGAFGLDSPRYENTLTTVIIAVIAVLGAGRGLDKLERLERYALLATFLLLAILLIAFASHDIEEALNGGLTFPAETTSSPWQIATVLAGMLIVVQGFETSRYLGDTYSPEVRIASSRGSQIVSGVVYLLFVLVATPMMVYLHPPVQDNDLMVLAGKVAVFLPFLVAGCAMLSQFSAAVADTIAGVGNLAESTRGALPAKMAYLLIGGFAIVLTWSVDTMALITLASRAFAFYYFLQCLVALSVSTNWIQRSLLALTALALAFVVLFAETIG